MSEREIKDAARQIHELADTSIEFAVQAVVIGALSGRNCVEGNGCVISEEELMRICKHVESVMFDVAMLGLVIKQELAIYASGDKIEFSLTESGKSSVEQDHYRRTTQPKGSEA